MKLDDIGFYTLNEKRALQANETSPLYRCELIITGCCNFNCQYCRKIESRNIDLFSAMNILELWVSDGLKNVRFSGGEPTLYKNLSKLVVFCKNANVEKIAISTNGSADIDKYYYLYECGINDFSISLDACCAIDNDKMNGVSGYWDKITTNIKKLSEITYVTVGIVLDERNIKKTKDIIKFAHDLGVADIRIIPAAQYQGNLNKINLNLNILDSHPILNYRWCNNEPVRGLTEKDSCYCYLAIDDMMVDMDGYHYPCIIYFREKGKPIGKIDKNVRMDRKLWVNSHDCLKDQICRNNCLDVCRDYNNFYKNIRRNRDKTASNCYRVPCVDVPR